MPEENRVEGRYDDSSMELDGLDCLLIFSICSVSLFFFFSVDFVCLILTETTTITLVKKKKLLKSIHGNFNSSENLCRLKPLPIIPKKPF